MLDLLRLHELLDPVRLDKCGIDARTRFEEAANDVDLTTAGREGEQVLTSYHDLGGDYIRRPRQRRQGTKPMPH